MKQYIITEEQIKAIEVLLLSMGHSMSNPAQTEVSCKAVSAGLRNHEYIESSSTWVQPYGWTYTYKDLPITPITCKQKGYHDKLNAVDKALKEAEAAIANNKYKE